MFDFKRYLEWCEEKNKKPQYAKNLFEFIEQKI